MLKQEYKLLKCFIAEPWKGFGFQDIAKGYSSRSYVYSRIKRLLDKGILRRNKIGNVFQYWLDFNVKSFAYLGFIAEHIAFSRKNIPFDEIEEVFLKMPTDFFIGLITGSYVKGKETKKSDLDLVIICDDSFNKKKIYSELRHKCEMSIPFIHLYVFKQKDFLEMLLNNEENYGKETARSNLVLHGGEEYFKIISKAVGRGLSEDSLKN
jgi:DNA polymerase sigma